MNCGNCCLTHVSIRASPKPLTPIPLPRGRPSRVCRRESERRMITLRPPGRGAGRRVPAAASTSSSSAASSWDDKPYEVLPGGSVSYLDEQDVATFLDPPKELIPLEPDTYNPAAYLWKKIGDIPEERRHRLLLSLKPRLIPRLWQVAGARYSDDKLMKKSSSNLLSSGKTPLEIWSCRTSSGPFPISWLNDFTTVIFCGDNGSTYGRVIIGGSALSGIAKFFPPLYFIVGQLAEVMATEQPCDLAYEFGNGLLDLTHYPEGFPKPAKHPWPFNDDLVFYIRHAGPGVMVAQAWQEGKELEQVPKKFCGEILMVKELTSAIIDDS